MYKDTKFSLSLQCLAGQSFEILEESALYSLKSPNYQKKYIRGIENSSYIVGCSSMLIYGCLAIPYEYARTAAHFLL